MTKRTTPKAADKIEIKIDGKPYVIETPVRDLLATSTQVRDILAHALVEWSDGYFDPTKKEGKEEFHWTELKLKELVDKLLSDQDQRTKLDEERRMENSGDKD